MFPECAPTNNEIELWQWRKKDPFCISKRVMVGYAGEFRNDIHKKVRPVVKELLSKATDGKIQESEKKIEFFPR